MLNNEKRFFNLKYNYNAHVGSAESAIWNTEECIRSGIAVWGINPQPTGPGSIP